MKRLCSILILICALGVPGIAFGQWIPSNEVNGTLDGSSYDLADKSFWGDYFSTYFYCMYPQYTNHIYSWSRSGAGWGSDYGAQEEKWCLPLWNSFAVPGYNWVQANDNEGLISNTTYSAGVLIAAGPPLFYNGTAQTNEGIATAGITFIPMGRVPHDGSDGDSGAVPGNAGSMQLAADLGVPVIDLWHRLWTNGWSADVVGSRILGFSVGSHPLPPGGLAIAMHELLGLNVETNVGSFTLNFSAATVSATNHSVVSGVSLANNTLTATVHFDRMPMAWDTNATAAFGAMPSLGNAFNWIIQVTNLPVGYYKVYVDGHLSDVCSSAQLAAGRNWATNCVRGNPLWEQRLAVLAWKRLQKGQDPDSLAEHSAGNSGPLGSDTVNFKSNGNNQYDTLGKRGSTYVSSMISFVTALRGYDAAIQQASIQTNHVFTFVLDQQVFEPILAALPDERDVPTLHVPDLNLPLPMSAQLKLALASVIAPPAPTQWFFQPAPVAPAHVFHLTWDAAQEASSYAVQLTPDLARTFYTLTNTAATNAVVNVPASIAWSGFFRVLSVNTDGLNTVGAYERID